MDVQAVAPHSLKVEMSFVSSGLPETKKGHDCEKKKVTEKCTLQFCPSVSSVPDSQHSNIQGGFELALMINELEGW